jgi:CHAT domain-containing protein
MKIRRGKVVLWALAAFVVPVLISLTWLAYRFLFPTRGTPPEIKIVRVLATNDPHRILEEADRYYWTHNLPAAAPLYQRAEQLFDKAHDDRNTLYAKVGLVRSQLQMPFGGISEFVGAQLKTPLVQNDPELRLWCLGVKGDADLELQAGAARQDWEEAKSLAERLGKKNWANRASGELGLVGFLEGDYHRASHAVGQALLTSVVEGDVGTEVRYLEIVGNGLNELNRPSEGLAFLNRAIAIADRDKDVGTPFMAYEGKATALGLLKHMDEAQALMEWTLAEARKEKMWEHEGQDLLILGQLATLAGERKKARKYLEEAIQSEKKSGLVRVVEQSFLELSGISRQEGDLKKAGDELGQALQISQQTGDTYYVPRVLDALADLKAKMGQPKEAHQLYEQASDIIEGMLSRVSGAYFESSLLSAMTDTYLGDFKLAAEESDVPEAFEIIEHARGRAVADALRNRRADPPPAPADASIRTQIANIQTQLINANNQEERGKLLDDLTVTEEKYGYLNDMLSPSQRQVATQPVSLTAAQQSILADETVLEYVLAEPNSYCLALSHERIAVVKLPAGQAHIDKLVSTFLTKITKGNFAQEEAKQLYSLLVAPVPESSLLRHLVIVPDGSLYQLPFDALIDPKGQYLLKIHVVSYAPSTTVLCFLRNRHNENESQMAFLGVGDVPYDLEPPVVERGAGREAMRFVARGIYDISGAHLYHLQAARQELLDVDQAIGRPRQTLLLLGGDATESKFKSEPLSDFKIIHFAVHGISTPHFPERAALVLGRDPKSSDDGLLQFREIARLPLTADLVTLSACDTASGELQGEEGNTGLVQAFLFAGAKSVVASVWSVDDSATELLMKQFYIHLAEKEDKASALRQAKLDYLEQMGNVAPIYWAAFVLVGDGSGPVNF